MDSSVNPDGARARLTVTKGEMPGWSDLAVRGGAGGPVLHHLVGHHLHDRSHAVVVGPHDWTVVDLVVARAQQTTVLLRGHADALQALDRYSGDNVEVICGDLGSVSLDRPADALVALDGFGRTVSAETEPPTWQETLSLLWESLTQDATILLSVENPLGLTRLAQVPLPEADDADDAWCSVSRPDVTRPQTLDQALAVLAGDGAYALHPTVTAPTLATSIGAIPAGSGLEALVIAHNTLSPARLDTRTTMRKVADAGRLDEFAAGWLLVSGGSPSTPLLAVSGDRSTGVTETISRHGESLVRRVEAVDDIALDGWRVAARAEDQSALPDGRLLEDVLLEACATRDIGRLRHLLATTAELVRSATPAELEQLAGVTCEGLVLQEDGGLAPLSPYLHAVDTPDADALLLGLFDDFAARIVALGWKHPWPVAAGRDEIVLLMAAAVGIQSTVNDVSRARKVREAADVSRGRLVSGVVAAQPETVERLRQENEALASKVSWFESAVRQREALLAELRQKRAPDQRRRVTKKLQEAEAELAAIKGSRSFRVAQVLTQSARAARRLRRK